MSKFEEIKIKLRLSIGFVGDRADEVFLHKYIDENSWNKMNLFERDDFIEDEILNTWAADYIEKSYEVNEDE